MTKPGLSYATICYWLAKVKEWHDPDEHLAPPQQEELTRALSEAFDLVAEHGALVKRIEELEGKATT